MELETADVTASQTAPMGMPRIVQLLILALVAAVSIVGFQYGPALYRTFVTKEQATETPVAAPTAGFKPTDVQWATLTVEPVKTADFQPYRRADGKIAINDDRTTAVFAPYSGRVTSLRAREGDKVVPGQPLFSIASTDLVQAQNDLVTATAGLAKAQAQVALMQKIELRAHALFDAQGGALKDWQQAQTDLAGSQNDLKSAQIALAAVQDRLRILGQSETAVAEAATSGRTSSDLMVTAPIAGIVLERKLGLGQYLTQGAGDPVFKIGNVSTVWLVANVRETDARFVHIGQSVDVTVTAYPGKVFKATIFYVASSVDSATHRLPIRAEVENPDALLKPEMWAEFRIAVGASRSSLSIPAQAIVYDADTARVWVADKDHLLTSREISTGVIDGPNVEILSGLAVGDQVVTKGSIFVDRAASEQ